MQEMTVSCRKKKKKTGPVMTNALVLTKENNWLQRDKPRQD